MISVVGIGQPLRGDDAVGWQVVQELPAQEGVRKLLVGDDPTRILDLLETSAALIVVDAMCGGGAPGKVHRLDLHCPVQSEPLRFSSHTLDPLQVVNLARQLGRKLPPRMVLLALEGQRFTPGAPLSEAASGGLADLRACLTQEIALARPG